MTGVGGWGAEDELTDFFSFSPSCDVLSSFFSLPFFCCFFSFLKRCFSSFVKSFPSFYFTKRQQKHDRQPKTGLTQDLDKFKHEPSLARCHRSRESFLQNCQQNKHLITPRYRRLFHDTTLKIPDSTTKTNISFSDTCYTFI